MTVAVLVLGCLLLKKDILFEFLPTRNDVAGVGSCEYAGKCGRRRAQRRGRDARFLGDANETLARLFPCVPTGVCGPCARLTPCVRFTHRFQIKVQMLFNQLGSNAFKIFAQRHDCQLCGATRSNHMTALLHCTQVSA